MSKMDIDAHNYDKVFKDAFSIFSDKVLDFLDLQFPAIQRFMETQIAEIETKGDRMDLNFWFEDGSILHIEEEVHLSVEDVIRFAAYDVELYHRYKTKINTVALCLNSVSRSNCNIDAGSFVYKVQVVDMSERDGDAKLNELLAKVKTGAMVNELELIFLPLMKRAACRRNNYSKKL
ncbi:hypothetical protein [Petroclostridium sp. X23]|uniref:hypothetical protein n=1 Tax=Petroclostridium sp. X23 TaxID=3045146 RepID=UPI0024ACDA07|nr:hypothetical protein [Petroclostridium sp. X23]WHH57387.1 hypothetical protein QKW49_16310 [Petroclostridium sp. X23]